MEAPHCHGGFGDVWKGHYDGREVAAKALRVYQTSNFERIRKASYSRMVVCINGLIVSRTEVLQGSCDMEGPESPERVTTDRRDDDQDSIRDGIGMDVKWEYQPISEGEYQRR